MGVHHCASTSREAPVALVIRNTRFIRGFRGAAAEGRVGRVVALQFSNDIPTLPALDR